MGIRSHLVYSATLDYSKMEEISYILLQLQLPRESRQEIKNNHVLNEIINSNIIIYINIDINLEIESVSYIICVNNMFNNYNNIMEKFVNWMCNYIDSPHIGCSGYLGFIKDENISGDDDEHKYLRIIEAGKRMSYEE